MCMILTLYLGSLVIWLPCEYKSAGGKLKACYCSLPNILLRKDYKLYFCILKKQLLFSRSEMYLCKCSIIDLL